MEHQRIISRLLGTLSHRYYNEKTLSLEPLPETMLNPDQTSPVPDVSLDDLAREETPVIIEVTHTRMVKADFRKVQRLIESDDYGIQEGFVYDYKKICGSNLKKVLVLYLKICHSATRSILTLPQRIRTLS